MIWVPDGATLPEKRPKTGCVSCEERSRSSTIYKLEGFPERVLALPYFLRLSASPRSIRLCPKCVAVLEFAKKLISVFAPTATPITSNAKPIEEVGVAQTQQIPTKPPLVEPITVKPSPVVVPAMTPIQLPPKTPPPSKPSSDKKRSAQKIISLNPVLSNPAVQANVKLPKGVTWSQLNCCVAVNRLENMRVPPIRIRDLKLQSIMKSSPEKSHKRVSFNNVPPQIFQIAARNHDNDDVDKKKKKKKEFQVLRKELLQRNVKMRRSLPNPSSSPPPETPPRLKRPRRMSTTTVNYEEPITLPSESDSDDDERPIASRVINPPPKKFKVQRPKQRRKAVSLGGVTAAKPSVVAPLVVKLPVNGHSRVVSPQKTLLVRNLFQGSAGEYADPLNGLLTMPNDGNLLRNRLTGQGSEYNLNSSPGKSPNRRSRRLSVDGGPMVILPEDDTILSSVALPPGASPARITNRRKTMDPTQHDHEERPEYGKLRLVSIDKLRAPNAHVDFIWAGLRNHQTVLPQPFVFSP